MFAYEYPLEDEYEVIASPISRQLPDNPQTRALQSNSEIADAVLTWVFIGSVFINLVLSNLGSMEYTLTMINSLQMVVHLPIFSVVVPGNVMMFLQIILPIVMFDVLEPLESMGISAEQIFSIDLNSRREQQAEMLN